MIEDYGKRIFRNPACPQPDRRGEAAAHRGCLNVARARFDILDAMTVSQKLTSNRPYLLRALYEWIGDNGMTPHLLVDARRRACRCRRAR